MARLIALIGVVVTFAEGSNTASDESCSSEKLKIAVIGASPGTTDRLFMKMALDAGHSVTAIARTLSKIEEKHDNLTVVHGDVKKLVEPIQGCDVVVGRVIRPSGIFRHVQGDNLVFRWHKRCNLRS